MSCLACVCTPLNVQETTFEYEESKAALRFELPAGASCAGTKEVAIQF